MLENISYLFTFVLNIELNCCPNAKAQQFATGFEFWLGSKIFFFLLPVGENAIKLASSEVCCVL